MNRSETAKTAEGHVLNAVNRIEFQTKPRLKDPFGRLAAAIILQAVIDRMHGESERFYWYYGRKVWIRNEMTEEDYRFYADLAGIECSWSELLGKARRNTRLGDETVMDAAELLCN